ncbi:MAG: ABC transporter ATP-binding protein/permease [Planctomycetaceae bacterium]|nr:ABC transporter ATP-binding protein/permease [Planctomycetaceae bacterium]
MQNLFRAIRLTFRYKFSIAASIFCALLISVLWGGNIGVLTYPIVEICLKNDNFVDWLDRKIDENEKAGNELRGKITALEGELEAEPEKQKSKAIEKEFSSYRDELWWNDLYHFVLLRVQPTVNRFCPRDPFLTLVMIVAFLLVGTLLKAFLTILHTILSARIAAKTIFEIRNQMFRKIIRYEVNYFSQEGISNVMSRIMGEVNSLSLGLTVFYGKLIREPFKMAACLVGAAMISWQLLLLTLIIVPVAAYFIRWLARSLKRVVRRSLEQAVLLFSRLEESIRSVRIVKAFTTERHEFGKFRQTNHWLYRLSMKTAKYDSLTNPLTEVLGVLMICIAVLAGSYLVMNQKVDICGIPMCNAPLSQTLLITFFALLAGASDPARKLSDIFTQCQTAVVAANRVYELIDREIPVVDPPKPIRLSRHSKSIVFDRVSFHYKPELPILRNVSLEIAFGETIGIVGPSGCGKSTMLSLIPRFADTTAGEVRIDGVAVRDAKMRDVRQMMGIITQEPILFNDTIMNNIRYGSPFATEAEAVEAAKNAFAHEFIEKELSNGYATIVGPGGALLSGGQRQRIALARAFLCDPAILLLDEATSQIDLYSEQKIHEALAKFIGKRTTILVTHRLSALTLTDRIVVLRDGVIESVGTQQELLAQSPYFARLSQIEQNECPK